MVMCVLLACTAILGKLDLKKCVLPVDANRDISLFKKVIMPGLLYLLDNIKLRVFYTRDAT